MASDRNAESFDATDRAVYLDGRDPIDPRQLDLLGATPGLTGVSAVNGACGDVHITDHLNIGNGASVTVRRHVLAFFQGNRYLLGALVSHVTSQLPPSSEVLDLYAGVGLFSMAAGVGGGRIRAVEGDRIAAADLKTNAANTGGTVVAIHQSVEEFLRGASARRDRIQPDCDAVIVDPPRTGLSSQALEGVAHLRAARIVYVSCDVATLARDTRQLIDAGYTLTRADGFDLFPNTPHIETVVVFDR